MCIEGENFKFRLFNREVAIESEELLEKKYFVIDNNSPVLNFRKLVIHFECWNTIVGAFKIIYIQLEASINVEIKFHGNLLKGPFEKQHNITVYFLLSWVVKK